MVRFRFACHGACLSLALLTGALAVGCSSSSSPEERELDRARDRWEDADLSHYQFHFQRSCFCPSDITAEVIMRVRDGEIEDLRYVETGQAVAPERVEAFQTVDELFDIIEEAIATDADRIEVTYDPQYGYPRSVFIDYEFQAADEEERFVARDLRPL